MDTYVERTRKGWFGRIGDSFGGALIGILLFLVAFPLLFWNEGRAVRRYKDLEFGRDNVVSVASGKVDPKKEGKLIYADGKATPVGKATDATFGLSVDAIRLERKVEMYQWKESSSSKTKKKVGGGEETVTEYKYDKAWSSTLQDSDRFKVEAGHQNPRSMPYDSAEFAPKAVKLGAFTLHSEIADDMDDTAKLNVTSAMLSGAEARKAKITNGQLYFGPNPSSPRVGDTRVTFHVVKPAVVSVVGKQAKSSIVPFKSKEIHGDIALLEYGKQGAPAMFEAAEQENWILTWILRFVGWLLMFVGLRLLVKPLSVLADLIPLLGSAVGCATGFVAFFIASGLSFITIAIAWVFYRPLVGILLFVGALGALTVGFFIARKVTRDA